MAPSTEQADAHQVLLDQLDINCLKKPFRNANWKPNSRRNKNIKNIIGDAVRKEVSLIASQQQSSGAEADATAPSVAQTSRNLAKMVLARNTLAKGQGGPNLTYMGIESGPSLSHPKHYCDITGLQAPYTDPKTRLRYHNKEVFGIIRTLGPGAADEYLEARGAHTILK